MAHILFATCPRGAESALAAELKALGASAVRPVRAGVSFEGPADVAYRVVLGSRVASRVLMGVSGFEAQTADELYEATRQVPWEDHVAPDGTLAVDFTGSMTGVRNTMFGAQRVKDAIVDRMRDRAGRRPSVDARSPDLRVNVSVRRGRVSLAVDLAGEPLHRRGYREPGVQAQAPLKENLAATVLQLAGWRRIAESGGAFADPMCGSGTLVIEAAMIALDVAPGLLRDAHPLERWRGHDAGVWAAVLDEARARREAASGRTTPMVGSDADPEAVEIARRCAVRAGLAAHARFEVRRARDCAPPDGAGRGLVAFNPPYGERLSVPAGLRDETARVLSERFGGWRVAMLAPAEDLAASSVARWEREHPLRNGAIDVKLMVGSPLRAAPRPPRAAPVREVSAEEFANRLSKNAKRLGRWARREGVTCWRVYDADLPDFAFAIDRYEGAGPGEGRLSVHLAEYEAPREVEPQLATARLDAALSVIPDVLGVDPGEVFVKVRRRQRGEAQYGRFSRQGAVRVVAEGEALLLVNLSDYLDTGLFLDHRPLRSRVRAEAAGRRVLNLFGYTGAFTVHAAVGGAASTTTVDLSRTYLDWAGRSMELNGLGGPEHEFVREDVRGWLDRHPAGSSFDLAVLDAPAFSNSKRMQGVLDIQRDHPSLVRAAVRLLAPGGVLYFSTNLRGLRFDESLAAELGAQDITASTIPPDFARDPRIHRCWRIEVGR